VNTKGRGLRPLEEGGGKETGLGRPVQVHRGKRKQVRRVNGLGTLSAKLRAQKLLRRTREGNNI